MLNSPGISIENVSMRYEEGPPVIRLPSLEVPAGSFHSIIGPSGCGKSTLLRLIAGLLKPNEGKIRVAGADPCKEQERKTGFVFQEPALLPWLNVLDNIAMPLLLRGMNRLQRRKKAAELAERLGLEDCGSYYPRQLSGGMKMRVSVARALATAPEMMLFDEPFTGLDAIRRDLFGEDLLKVWKLEGWTALFVTHNVTEAAFLGQKVHVMGTQPGTITSHFDVPFPFPRNSSLRSNPHFQKVVADISEGLREAMP